MGYCLGEEFPWPDLWARYATAPDGSLTPAQFGRLYEEQVLPFVEAAGRVGGEMVRGQAPLEGMQSSPTGAGSHAYVLQVLALANRKLGSQEALRT